MVAGAWIPLLPLLLACRCETWRSIRVSFGIIILLLLPPAAAANYSDLTIGFARLPYPEARFEISLFPIARLVVFYRKNWQNLGVLLSSTSLKRMRSSLILPTHKKAHASEVTQIRPTSGNKITFLAHTCAIFLIRTFWICDDKRLLCFTFNLKQKRVEF